MSAPLETNPIVQALIRAFNAELETTMNYIAASTNLDGVRGKQVAAALAADINSEILHAQTLAKRIKTLGGVVPGSMKFTPSQTLMQPPADSTDVVAVIRGVIAAENDAIRLYEEIIKLCEGKDYPTQDVAIEILTDEQEHRREFVGFLKEYERAAI